MDQSSSRRLRRESLEKIEVCKAKWKLRFYCWRWSVFLVIATAQAVDVLLAVVEHRTPHIVLELRTPP